MSIADIVSMTRHARVPQRQAAVQALAHALLAGSLDVEDRCAAEAALTLMLDDPSPKVRAAMAEVLAPSRRAPLQLVMHLAADQPEVAGPVLTRSPLLSEFDLVDRVAVSGEAIRVVIARRTDIANAVAAAIAELGGLEACLALLANDSAQIAAVSFRRMVDRHGDAYGFRAAALADPRLPGDCRHALMVRLGELLQAAPLVQALIGPDRARRVTRDACIKASLTLVEAARPHDHPALIEHLRLRGELTPAFLIRCVTHGKIEFFARILASLCGQTLERIHALLVVGRETALRALLGRCGLPDAAQRPILHGLELWRDIARGRRLAGVQEVSRLVLASVERDLGAAPADRELAVLAALMKAIHVEALTTNARHHSPALAAA